MARYCDGRTALVHERNVDITINGLQIDREIVPWVRWTRADDGRGDIVLKTAPDTGERITLNDEEAATVRAFRPYLVSRKALPRERLSLVAGLALIAGALGAVLLLGAPMQAEAISRAMPDRYRDHLADIGWTQVDAISTRCSNNSGAGWRALNSMFGQLRGHARGGENARLELVRADFPNAFTLPDDTIVLTTGMLELADDPDQIAGVVAHELGHVEARHVLTNMVRQMSLGLFVDVVLGGSGAAQAAAAINVVSLRFSREDENEADIIGLRIMDLADINPGAMAKLFRRIAADEKQSTFSVPELLRSHPDSEARAKAAERIDRRQRKAAMGKEDWQRVRALCAKDE